jgi:hypothetical protein
MIVAIVQFPLPTPMSRADAADWFESGASVYQQIPGLQRKHFLLGDDGATAGGVYLWETRDAADSFYNDTWRARLAGKYGEPTVEYFESPVTVDPTAVTRT